MIIEWSDEDIWLAHKIRMSLQVLTEWLGQGGTPASRPLAENRAKICEMCVENRQPNWWQEMTTDPIAGWIRKALEVKQGMDLHLPNEEDLGMCRVCGCCTRLKVWTPLEHIFHHTPPGELEKYPPHCWYPQELNP